MAINFTTFFTQFGHAINSAKTLLQNIGPDQDTAVQSIIDSLDSASLDVKRSIDGVIPRLRSIQASSRGIVASLISKPMQTLLYETVTADTGKTYSMAGALNEFLDQLETAGSTVDQNTVSVSVTPGGGNTGTGTLIATDKLDNGEVSQLLLDEDVVLTCTTVGKDGVAAFTGKGDRYYTPLDPNYPGGSGVSFYIQPINPTDSSNIVTNPDFGDTNLVDSELPDGWIAADADATGSLRDPNSQAVTIASTPTSGWWRINVPNIFSSTSRYTEPLAYNAAGATVQAALRKLDGLGSVEVTTTGTSPNYTHTISFIDAPSASPIAVTYDFDTGTATAGAPSFTNTALTGGRTLLITGNGSEQTDYYVKLPDITTSATYAFHAYIKATTVTTGVLQAGLYDSVGGSLIADESGTNNTASVTLSGIGSDWYHFTAFFRTPENLSSDVYLRLYCSTAIDSSGTLDIDSVYLGKAVRVMNGGPAFAMFQGDTYFAVGDTFTLSVNNDYASDVQMWMDRVYGTRNIGRQLASAVSPTFPDGTYVA